MWVHTCIVHVVSSQFSSIVGHETTSTSLSYALWELARHPEKQKRLRDEVLAYPSDPSYDDLQTELPYLDACCREAMRFHPPSAHMERIAEKDDILPLRFPITKSDGTKSTELLVEKGQVRPASSFILPSFFARLNIWRKTS